MKNLISTSRRYLLYALPAVLFFSYYPRIFLGENNLMNFELSLPLIWLAVFALLSLPELIRLIRGYAQWTTAQKFLFATAFAFISYSSLSTFWSENKIRTILTAGIMWCIFISAFSIKNILTNKEIKKNILKIFLISSILVCAFCWIQSFLDLIGVQSSVTMICRGCTTSTFGFPHPNGFAIEPQFMGNLLLAPSLVFFYMCVYAKTKTQKVKFAISTIFVTSTLFFTFSRGAIYAFCIALIFLCIFLCVREHSLQPSKTLPLVLCSFIISLCAQGIFAGLSYTNDTFLTGITKSIHHLSLGIIDLREKEQNQPADQDDQATFDGYVSESTEIRLSLTEQALQKSLSSPAVFFFGVGLGGAGSALGSKEIIQNEYASIFLELGIIGIVLLLQLMIIIFHKLRKNALAPVILSVLLSYLISMCFFSGLPNALHIYLLPELLLFIL